MADSEKNKTRHFYENVRHAEMSILTGNPAFHVLIDSCVHSRYISKTSQAYNDLNIL